MIIFVFFRYTCVGRNGFNKEGDREEGHVQVNFVKGKSQYEQKTEILKIGVGVAYLKPSSNLYLVHMVCPLEKYRNY